MGPNERLGLSNSLIEFIASGPSQLELQAVGNDNSVADDVVVVACVVLVEQLTVMLWLLTYSIIEPVWLVGRTPGKWKPKKHNR